MSTAEEARGLERIRVRRQRAWLATLALFIVPILAALLIGREVFQLAAVASLVAWAGLSWFAAGSRCPRCGKLFCFNDESLVVNPWRRSCGHCGLMLGE